MIILRVITPTRSYNRKPDETLTKYISKLVGKLEMNSNRKGKHVSKTLGVYLSAITIVLSLILALLSLDTPILLISYFVSTLSITGITYLLRTYLLHLRKSEQYDNLVRKRPPRWRNFALILLMLIAVFVFPLFLAGFVDPYLWFIFMISLASGVSVSQLVVYLRREESS